MLGKINKNLLLLHKTIKEGLKIGSLNICHLLPKLDKIKIFLNEPNTIQILGLCETFLNDDILNNELQVKGFKFERKDRNNKHGGGLLVYIKNDLSYKRRLDLESVEIEYIWLELNSTHHFPNHYSHLLYIVHQIR